jgi:hypothetical protein
MILNYNGSQWGQYHPPSIDGPKYFFLTVEEKCTCFEKLIRACIKKLRKNLRI